MVLQEVLQSSSSGVPNLQATDQYQSVTCQEPGHTAGGEWQTSKRSFICCSPLLTLLPDHPRPPTPDLWKNCLPGNQSLVPKTLGTATLVNRSLNIFFCFFLLFPFLSLPEPGITLHLVNLCFSTLEASAKFIDKSFSTIGRQRIQFLLSFSDTQSNTFQLCYSRIRNFIQLNGIKIQIIYCLVVILQNRKQRYKTKLKCKTLFLSLLMFCCRS